MKAARLHFVKNDSGAALAESAIALPLIVVIFGTIFAFGSTLRNTQVLETAARDAARYLAHTAATSANETSARNIAVYANAAGTGTARVRGLTTGNVAISYATVSNPISSGTGERTYRGQDPLRLVSVNISWTAPSSALWNVFGSTPITYHAVNQQRVIGD
ncbi:MAG: pilus assembly protein [Proteobacteria bacterium]|nr:pilus assembly protein [Pseudomonadota bacterium]